MSRPHKPYLELIRSALDAIDSYRPENCEAFQMSPMAQDAILMRMQEIGENMAHIRQLDDERFNEIGQTPGIVSLFEECHFPWIPPD